MSGSVVGMLFAPQVRQLFEWRFINIFVARELVAEENYATKHFKSPRFKWLTSHSSLAHLPVGK